MNWFLSRLIFVVVYLMYRSFRFRAVGLENLKLATTMGKTKGYLLGIFHQNLFAGIVAQTKINKYIVIVSKSKDANPVAYTCATLGHLVVRGSSKRGGVDKGGKQAKDEMIEVLKQGNHAGAVTVDGPKGPALVVKAGIVDMAKKVQIPIVPYICIPENYWSFNSWDKFRLPKPFSKVIVYYGKPFLVPEDTRDEDFEKYQMMLQTALINEESLALKGFKEWQTLPRNTLSN